VFGARSRFHPAEGLELAGETTPDDERCSRVFFPGGTALQGKRLESVLQEKEEEKMKRTLGVSARWMTLLAAACFLFQPLAGCSDKKEPLPPPAPVPVIDMTVSFNQVAMDLNTLPTAQYTIRDEDGTSRPIRGVRVSDWLGTVPGVAPEDYRYDFIDNAGKRVLDCLGGDTGLLPTAADLAHAYFYDDSGDGNGLQILWDEEKNSCFYVDDMDGGSLPAYPGEALSALKKELSYVMEMDGDVPVHLGETVYVEGTATVGTDVIVSGRYLKFHIQDDTAGIYIFADTQATEAVDGYDGSTFLGVNLFEGNRVFLQGTIGEHDGMVEFHPVSGYVISVTGYGLPLPAPQGFDSVDDLFGSGTTYVGSLVRVNQVQLIAGDWPPYGQKVKGLELQGPGDVNVLYSDIYQGSGIPGSLPPPEDGFDMVGLLHRQVADGVTSYLLYPRGLYDLDTLSAPQLSGTVALHLKDQAEADWVHVDLGSLAQCAYDVGLGAAGKLSAAASARPIVSLASLIVPQAVLDPKKWEYKIKARDGQQPFEALSFEQLKSGLLYAGDVGVNSHFYEGMGLSPIYYLNDVAEVVIYPLGGGPKPGPAVHGEGINLLIDGTNYPVNFQDLPDPAQQIRPLSDFIPANIIDIYTMGGSFSYDQIVVLYDYELVPYGAAGGCFPVTWDQIQPTVGDVPMVDLTSGLPVLTGLGACGTISDLFTIRMVRKVILEKDGVQEVFYWKDLPFTPVGSGEEMEQVVFLDALLDAAGITQAEKPLYDYYLSASDSFGTWFTYGHHHLVDMYFNPLSNRTWTTDEGMQTNDYSARVSIKALLGVVLATVPQEQPPSVCIQDLGCLSDPVDPDAGKDDPCYGCHVKKGAVNIPVNCAACHN
jgi:hypothetical protein